MSSAVAAPVGTMRAATVRQSSGGARSPRHAIATRASGTFSAKCSAVISSGSRSPYTAKSHLL